MYFEIFTCRGDIAREFEIPLELIPTDEEILIAFYEHEDYSGYAFVLFQKNGKLFEVHGSHCSCYGLWGQWAPEETTWEALKIRVLTEWDYSEDVRNEFQRLVALH